MKKRAMLLLMLIPLCLTLFGCRYAPMERPIYPICLSIDQVEDDKIMVGIQAPHGTQSGSEGGDQSYDILSATGDSLKDALTILAASTPYPINFSELRLCLIGYEMASTTELRTIFRRLDETPTMRPNAYIMVALGNAYKVMQAQKSDLGMRISTHLNLLFNRLREEDLLPNSTLASSVRELGDGRRDPLLCICAINPQLMPQESKGQGGTQSGDSSSGGGGAGNTGNDGGGEEPVFAIEEMWVTPLVPEGIIAGMLPRTSMNPVEYLGAAVLSNGRVSGLLTAQEAQVALRAIDEATMRVAINGDDVQLQIWVKKGTELEKKNGILLDVIKKLQALNSDALGFGGASTASFYEDAAWEAFDFHGKYSGADMVICVE